MKSLSYPSRRMFCGSLVAGAAVVGAGRARARAQSPSPSQSSDHGRIKPPIAVPALDLTTHEGVATTLIDLVNHRATAVQLMFTSCGTTCPIQGAIFARVQSLLPDAGPSRIQLLSISVDPETDTSATLAKWLQKFHRRTGWVAAAPKIADVERLRDFAGRGRNPADNHSTQVQIVNRRGQVVWRTGELAGAEEIAALLRKV